MTDLVIPGAGEIHLLINEGGGNFEALSTFSPKPVCARSSISTASIALPDRRYVYPI